MLMLASISVQETRNSLATGEKVTVGADDESFAPPVSLIGNRSERNWTLPPLFRTRRPTIRVGVSSSQVIRHTLTLAPQATRTAPAWRETPSVFSGTGAPSGMPSDDTNRAPRSITPQATRYALLAPS